MVQLDEGVGNLERFIGVITDTSAKVDEGVEGLSDAAGRLEDVESDTEATLGDFVSTLEDVATDIGDAAESTGEAYDTLGQQAREIAQDRCGDAESDAHSAGEGFEERVESGGDALDTETASTVNDGFKVFGETLDRCTQDLKQSGQDADQAMKTLATDAASEGTEAEQAFDQAGASFDSAESELAAQASAIESASGETVSTLEGAGEDLESECTDQAGEAETTYQTAGDAVEQQSSELAGESQRILEATADELESGASQPLATVMSAAVDQEGGEYDAALDEVGAQLGAAADMSGELEPLVGELDKSESIVDEIDRLLKAME